MADAEFLHALQHAVVREVRSALGEQVGPLDRHRRLMERAKLFVSAFLWPGSECHGDAGLVAAARRDIGELRALQGSGGLFGGGGNLDSPPDTSFTVNDVCDTLHIIGASGGADAALAEIAAELDAIADAAEPALIAGGVHTPNHRWEISAALARLHRRRPSELLRDRATRWLAEGIDITTDGLYSERSANYAAHVSNPSLTVIADVFDHPDARAAVVRNLESTLGLINPDDTVETVHSRRQDQLRLFPLGPYLTMYRRYAIELGRGDLAWAARRALRGGVARPATALAELLIDPRIGASLPAATPPAQEHRWDQSALVVHERADRRLVVFGGTDYARFRRVRSGLSTNPTFLRLFAGDAVLDSVRLSRDFFGLGPFRADALTTHRGTGGVVHHELIETVSAGYYQPLASARYDPSGAYALTDEGRFCAAMSFPDRPRDEVRLRTRIDIAPTADGAAISLSFDGADCAWALELAFREGGRFEGVTAQDDGAHVLAHGTGRYRLGRSTISFEAGADYRADGPAHYHPGEEYAFLGATDAAPGRRVYLTGRSPGRLELTLRATSAGR
ncbi:hypothetical protein [Microbacterium sp.]|uniref:hypothetical protein n=1 Tax=Microbacterium sp. TaxID=51671 RepID=UPI0039E5836B